MLRAICIMQHLGHTGRVKALVKRPELDSNYIWKALGMSAIGLAAQLPYYKIFKLLLKTQR